MDGATFARELNKYKIVRLADHTKIRWKTQRVRHYHRQLVEDCSAIGAWASSCPDPICSVRLTQDKLLGDSSLS